MALLGERYYDPVVGRFLSPDPIGHAGGLNLYRYCEGDPVNGVDPSGLLRTTPLPAEGAETAEAAEAAGAAEAAEVGGAAGGAGLSAAAAIPIYLVPIEITGDCIWELARYSPGHAHGAFTSFGDWLGFHVISWFVPNQWSALPLGAVRGVVRHQEGCAPGGGSGGGPAQGVGGPNAGRHPPLLYRFGADPDSAEDLSIQSAAALRHPKFQVHGVSTFSRPSTKHRNRVGSWDAVAQHFSIHKTGENPFHYTIELPQPVTPDVADRFNSLFKLEQ